MTQLGEGVLVDLGHHLEHTPDTCAFCTAPPKPTDKNNDFTDKHDEDAAELGGLEVDGIAFKNCADKLGQALIGVGQPQITSAVSVKSGTSGASDRILPLHTAAHHLIPGNAALKKSELKPNLHTEGMANGNIGYDVNNFENGVWLPGNYALRGNDGLPRWGPEGVNFKLDTGLDPQAYAFAAIAKTGRQFHDAHGDYSDWVLKDLNLLAKKIGKVELWCPEAKKESVPPEERQLFALVARLNTVSRRLKGFVCNASPKWRENLVTSRFSLAYIRKFLLT